MEATTRSDPWGAVFDSGWPGGQDRLEALASVEAALFGKPSAPRFLDRYQILQRVGAGGFGVVYEAEDVELARRVAIKMSTRGIGAKMTARFLREASVMAQLAHDNVLPVYDVGVHEGDRPFIVMELVDGTTLGAWCADESRTHKEILAAYIAAGRGLAAAHAAGVTHRDFKPQNVLVGTDRRVRVCDFGLAQYASSPADRSTGEFPSNEASDPLTQAGFVMGTPAYMAPEQHRGERVGPAADQFAFCAALFGALTGRPPYSAGDDLLRCKAAGEVDHVAASKLPRRVRGALLRGLVPDPTRRWPSMQSLLGALERRGPGLAAGLLGMAAVFVGAVAIASVAAEPDSCSAADNAAIAISEARVEGIRDAFERADAGVTWKRTQPHLEEFRQQWGSAYRTACAADEDALLDARVACLERALVRASALLDVFAAPKGSTVRNAVSASASLPPPRGCLDVSEWTPPEPEPDQLAEVQSIRGDIELVGALQAAGRPAEGLALAIAADERARTLGYQPLIARTALAVGARRLDVGDDPEAATQDLERAHFLARGVGDVDAALRAAILLIHATGFDQAAIETGERWARQARALAARREGRDRLTVAMKTSLGGLALRRGDFSAAIDLYRAASDLETELMGPRHPNLVSGLVNLGETLGRADRIDEASAVLKEAVSTAEATLGPDHPELARALREAGLVRQYAGALDEAGSLYARSGAIIDRAGDLPTQRARLSLLMGVLAAEQGDLEAALSHYRDAATRFEAIHGDEHPSVADALNNIGTIRLDQGELEDARLHFSRALGIYESAGDPSEIAMARGNLDEAQRHIRASASPEAP